MWAVFRSRLSYANVVATLALFVALGGGAYAAANLPANSVGSKQIQNKAVTPPKLAQSTIKLLKGKRGPQGIQGVQGPRGAQGNPGTNGTNATINGVSAGGDLAGTYPNPKIAPGVIGAGQLADGSVRTSKFAPGAQAPDSAALGGNPASAYATVGGTFTAATLNPGVDGVFCSWTNYTAADQNPAGYFRDAFGIVHLEGLVLAQDGSDSPCGASASNDARILVLPAGYAPAHQTAIATISNDKAARVNIDPTGVVSIEPNFPAWADAEQWVSLDGISFRCGPSGTNGCP